MRESLLGPAGLALAAVLVLSAVSPSGIDGSGLAAMGLLVGIAAVASSGSAAASPASRWLLASVPLAVVAARLAIAPGKAVEPAAWLILAGIAGLAAAHALDGEERFAWVFAGVVAIAGGRALAGALQASQPWRAGALDGFLILTLPAATAWALGKRGPGRAVGLGAAAAGAAGLLATASVPAIGALAAALALVGLRGRVPPRALALGAAVLGIGVLGLASASPDVMRAAGARAAFEIVRDHPLAGAGPGGFAEAVPLYRHASSLPFELAAEWGLPLGLTLSAVFFWLFVGPAARPERMSPTLRSGLTAGVAAFALHNLVGSTAFLPPILVSAAVCRGLIARPAAGLRATPIARTPWIATALALTVVAMGSGRARDALTDARDAAAAGDHATALQLALRAGSLAPWDADPPLFTAGARLAAGSSAADAVQDADRAVERAPARASARSVRASARSAAGDVTGAYADLVEASQLNPSRAEYASQRDALKAALGKAGEAAPR